MLSRSRPAIGGSHNISPPITVGTRTASSASPARSTGPIKKKSKGRVPVLAHCTEFHPDRVHQRDAFGRIEVEGTNERPQTDGEIKLLTLEDLPAEIREKLPAWARRLILEGAQSDEYHGDRSKAVWAVTCALLRANASDAQIAGLLLNPDLPIHEHIRDQKGHGPRAYVARQIERARRSVETNPTSSGAEPFEWLEPLDIIGAPELVGWPTLTPDCLPEPLYRYVMAEAERLNVDPCPLAGHVLAACSSSISDALTIKPKLHDRWTQQPRLWICVVKDVGPRGTEMIRSAFWPVKERDLDLLKIWRDNMPRGRNARRSKVSEKREEKPEDPSPSAAAS